MRIHMVSEHEAMACGAGVIVSAVGGHLDTVEHGVTGLHVPPKDPGRLGAVLAKLLHDTRRRRAMRRAGAARARSLYSWERVAEQTEAVSRRLITGDGSALELAGVKGLES